MEKHPKNAKKFRLHLGVGKSLITHKFEADSEQSRDSWFFAICQSIKYFLENKYGTIEPSRDTRSKSDVLDFIHSNNKS